MDASSSPMKVGDDPHVVSEAAAEPMEAMNVVEGDETHIFQEASSEPMEVGDADDTHDEQYQEDGFDDKQVCGATPYCSPLKNTNQPEMKHGNGYKAGDIAENHVAKVQHYGFKEPLPDLNANPYYVRVRTTIQQEYKEGGHAERVKKRCRALQTWKWEEVIDLTTSDESEDEWVPSIRRSKYARVGCGSEDDSD